MAIVTGPLDDPRLDGLVDLVVQLATGDLAARMEPSAARDAVDAVITGVNLLADELHAVHSDLEQRVAERTSQLRQAKIDLERLALTDALTGLGNRTLLADRIRLANSAAARGQPAPSVLLLDLDEFKTINDSLGHSAGDAVLVEVARRLTSVVRDTDTVARLGGDEFAIVMPQVTEDQVLRVAQRILTALRLPVLVGDRSVWVAASIGVRFGSRGQSRNHLLRDADTAMYAAKARGRGNIQVFQPSMHTAALTRMQVAGELGAAISAGQLLLHYQPLVELDSGCIVGAEALVRWLHPQRGLVPPAEFIAVAEESGLIVDIGHWVLREAISQLARWTPDLAPFPLFQLHVNLSPIEIRRPGVREHIRQVLDQHDVPPFWLAVEITETGLMTGDADGLHTLLDLQSLGVGLSIDDFGTGYSSISYLRRLPIDTVKVDQSLIADIATDPEQSDFVAAILRLIDSVRLRAVVEGIETAQQRTQLLAIGCAYGQGNHFSAAVPAAAMTALLRSGTPLRPAPATGDAAAKTGGGPAARSSGRGVSASAARAGIAELAKLPPALP
jgi:diguanylate cyclase (GGDEF)-like protein